MLHKRSMHSLEVGCWTMCNSWTPFWQKVKFLIRTMAAMSHVRLLKKTNKQILLIRDERKYCTQTVVDPGGIQQRLKHREGWPHVRSLTVLYIIFERKGNPFVYLILINRTPFTSLRGRRLKRKGKGISGARDHARGVSLPPSSHAPRISLTPKTPFPKTPFLFPFKRLPRRLPFHILR